MEDLAVQRLVTQLAVEALVVSVPPAVAALDEDSCCDTKRKVDGWQGLGQPPSGSTIDLAV